MKTWIRRRTRAVLGLLERWTALPLTEDGARRAAEERFRRRAEQILSALPPLDPPREDR